MNTQTSNFQIGICEFVEYQNSASLKLRDADSETIPRILRARTSFALAIAAGWINPEPDYIVTGDDEEDVYCIYSPKEDKQRPGVVDYTTFKQSVKALLSTELKGSCGLLPYHSSESTGITLQPNLVVLNTKYPLSSIGFQLRTSLRWMSDRKNAMSIYQAFGITQERLEQTGLDEMMDSGLALVSSGFRSRSV